jgi:glycosyltransferase involved in cell wall biosynthesis
MMLQVALSCLKMMKITAVILAKDEEACIEKVVKGALKKADRVIVVDGHSKDATREVAEKAGAEVSSDGGRGKGDGYRTAIKAVDAEGVIVFLMRMVLTTPLTSRRWRNQL